MLAINDYVIHISNYVIEKGKMMWVLVMGRKLYNEMEIDEDKLGFEFQDEKLMKKTCRRSNSAQEQ